MSTKTILSIHQPNFLPWIGLIHKIFLSTDFVILDDVLFSKNNFQNRNRINTSNGPIYLTVPVQKTAKQAMIKDILICQRTNWRKKHLLSIYYSYKKAPQFEEIYHELSKIYGRNYTKLIDLNLDILFFILSYLDVRTKIHFSSELNAIEGKTGRLVDICKKLQADTYLAGGDSDYLDRQQFISANTHVIPQNFIHPTYKQHHATSFISHLSIIDWLFYEPKEKIIEFFSSDKKKILYDPNEMYVQIS